MNEQWEEQLENGQEALRQTTGLLSELGERFMKFLPSLIIALAVFLIGALLARLLGLLVNHTMQRAKVGATAASFGHSLVRILSYTLVVIICLSILGVPMASIITVVGAAGVAVGLALQNSLSNLAGGFIILFAKPFQAGDYVIIGTDEGYVESVTILYTKLISRDNRSMYFPNGIVAAGELINLSQRGTLKISVPISVAYHADIAHVRSVLLQALTENRMFLADPKPMITVSAFSDSAVTLHVNVWVNKEDYFIAPSAVLELTKYALDEAGIEIPFPQICVHSVSAQ